MNLCRVAPVFVENALYMAYFRYVAYMKMYSRTVCLWYDENPEKVINFKCNNYLKQISKNHILDVIQSIAFIGFLQLELMQGELLHQDTSERVNL